MKKLFLATTAALRWRPVRPARPICTACLQGGTSAVAPACAQFGGFYIGGQRRIRELCDRGSRQRRRTETLTTICRRSPRTARAAWNGGCRAATTGSGLHGVRRVEPTAAGRHQRFQRRHRWSSVARHVTVSQQVEGVRHAADPDRHRGRRRAALRHRRSRLGERQPRGHCQRRSATESSRSDRALGLDGRRGSEWEIKSNWSLKCEVLYMALQAAAETTFFSPIHDPA